VIVLVDGGTASTAEALAAALRDKQVATLVGGKTFGDALAQTLYLLPDGSAYTLVTGKLLGPNGTDWQRVGLTPASPFPKGRASSR
jgi:carboxyl-terminal processing protease